MYIFRLYADDTTAYASYVSPLVLEYLINFHLEIVSNCSLFAGGVHCK